MGKPGRPKIRDEAYYKEYFKKWRQDHLEYKRAYDKAYSLANKDKIKAYDKEYYKANKEKWQDYNWLKKFNISREDYEALLAKQDGVCDICKIASPGKTRASFSIDHDHKTGKIRGLLCSGCNTAIGLMYESKETLANAIKYLEKHEGTDIEVDNWILGQLSGCG